MARSFASIALFTVLFTGCANLHSGKYRDASVSDAARQASGQPVVVPRAEQHTPILGNQRHEEERNASSVVNVTEEEDERNHDDASGKFGFQYMQVQYESSSLREGRFYSIYSESPHRGMQSLGINLTYGRYELPESGIVSDSISGVASLAWALYTKLYADDFSFIVAPYVLFSLGYGNMMWTYRQMITDSSGYRFSSDSLEFLEFKAGVGGELGRYGVLQISAYAGPVARIYLGRTYEGFRNDLFENRLDLTWSGMIGIGY